ncbi:MULTISPECIES: flagellar hook-associated protein FlgL [Clostridium]|uniref:flagellar hook-associated protein FlgL n=1 Tax=Clostridium TaxID=1485 RepID=UPI00129B157E|nr:MULTISPECIES: flagellar hook-associated protein FlgL [Clostridium]MBZ0312883.1 flagellar hook-associated protein FlgL [Clostridium butyricum]MDU1068711.1 flagellar hook-associated protein FlgL [Clostridium sp.]MDU1336954.1 flagellar hook-associated protein FlgL [Clostridium butyricum]MDU2676295.1 flagellar hook-associated protein FlgL [Clostridium sp.]MDU4210668.1 flagellar hook-associated protein FlgL [Clostridium sp.]
MRITSSMLSSNYLKNVSKNMNYIQTLQNQLSTGKEISRPSDDPYKASRIVKMYADISSNEQYNDNITDVTNFLDVTDTSITQISNLYSRVRELLVSAGNAAYGSEQMKSIQDEMKVKVDQLAQLLNTNFDGKYVFGGTKVDSKPVTVVDGKIQYADADGKAISVYKNSDGNFTTSKYTDNTLKTLGDAGSTSGKSVEDELNEELAGLGTSDTDRKNEIESMLDGSKKIYKTKDGKYTTSENQENTQVSIGSIDKNEINNEISKIDTDNDGVADDLANTDRLKELNQIKNGLISYNQIDADMKIEISQGVIIDYNKTASEILEFTDPEDPTRAINVADLFNNIIGNLNSEDGKEALTGENLADLDKAISNLLTKSSEVGAMQNRMESAANQNETENENLTTILSSVEDIDFTEKMIDFSTLMTVYKASLQISANILPKTIMDYL